MLCILNFQFPPFPWNFFFRDEEDGFGIRKEEGEVGGKMGARGGQGYFEGGGGREVWLGPV